MVWPRPQVLWFSKDNPTEHKKRKKKKKVDRRRGGKAISKSGQEWTLPAQQGQLKPGHFVFFLFLFSFCCFIQFNTAAQCFIRVRDAC